MNGHVIEKKNDNIVQTQSIMGRPSNPPWFHTSAQCEETGRKFLQKYFNNQVDQRAAIALVFSRHRTMRPFQ